MTIDSILFLSCALQNDKDKENYNKLIDIMKSSKNGKVVGVFSKDSFSGEFCEQWKQKFKEQNFENVDIGASLAYIMAPKEDSELVTIKKACMATTDVFGKYLKENIMEIIDTEKVSKFDFDSNLQQTNDFNYFQNMFFFFVL